MEAVAAIGLNTSVATLVKGAKLPFSLVQDTHQNTNDIRDLKATISDVYVEAQLLQRLVEKLPRLENCLEESDTQLIRTTLSQAAT
jgi:hypothetical protein